MYFFFYIVQNKYIFCLNYVIDSFKSVNLRFFYSSKVIFNNSENLKIKDLTQGPSTVIWTEVVDYCLVLSGWMRAEGWEESPSLLHGKKMFPADPEV